MGENSKIEWTDATWNVAVGCHKVSAGCANCYMYDYMKRYGRDPRVVTRTSPGVFNLPLRKNKDGSWKVPDGASVFTSSLTDFFHEDIDVYRDEAWAIIRQRSGLTFQILTKRPERIMAHLPKDWGTGYANVWIGTSVENQEQADIRIPHLLQVPARVRFLSMEPLLGSVNVSPWMPRTWGRRSDGVWGCDSCCNGDRCDDPTHVDRKRCRACGGTGAVKRVDWVIVGGESGHGARIMHPNWARSVRDQCVAAKVPFFFKQWGEWESVAEPGTKVVMADLPSDARVSIGDGATNHTRHRRVGKHAAGRVLDGRTWDEVPHV